MAQAWKTAVQVQLSASHWVAWKVSTLIAGYPRAGVVRRAGRKRSAFREQQDSKGRGRQSDRGKHKHSGLFPLYFFNFKMSLIFG